MTNSDSVLESRGITLPTKVRILEAVVFPVVTYTCESCTVKKVERWRFDTFKLWCWSRLLRVPWRARRSNQSILGIQPEYWGWRTDTEAETPVFWSSDGNSWLVGKVSESGGDWGQKEKRTSEDEMSGWHHRCNGRELGKTSEDDERQRDLVCCSPWCQKESDVTWWLNSNKCLHSCSLQLMGLKGAWAHWRLTGRDFLPQGPSSSHLYLASAVLLVSVQSLSCVWLFSTPWTAAHQASLSITNSQSFLKFMSITITITWWYHPTISSSVVPFSSCPQSFPALGSFQMSQLFTSGGQIIGVSASTSVLPMNTQDWSPLGWTGWISLQS